MYHNKTPGGGRPNVDPVVMVKLLVNLALLKPGDSYVTEVPMYEQTGNPSNPMDI